MGLNEKTNLQPGVQWTQYPPTQEDITRIRIATERGKLYAGEFKDVLERLDRYRVTYANAPEIHINFFQTMSQEFSKLIFGEDMKVTVPGKYQGLMDYLLVSTELQSRLMQMSDITGSIGGCPLKAWRDANGQVHIDLVSNTIYFPSFDPDDCTLLTGQTIAWERVDVDTQKKYIVREIHTPGSVERQVLDPQSAYRIDEEQYRKWYSDTPPVVATGYNDMLVEYIPNYRYVGSFWGVSDYPKIRDVVEEIIIRMSMIADILDKHARPKQVLPSELLDQIKSAMLEYRNELARSGLARTHEIDAVVGQGDLPRSLDAFWVPSEQDKGNLPRMVTWDANMTGAMAELDRLFDIFLSLSCMTPEVFGISKYGVSESGRALKFRNMRAISESNRKRQFMLPGLRRIIRAALFLAGAKVDLPDISIITQDGLPFDELEAAQISAIWVVNGLATQQSAMLNARPDLSRDAAAAEVAEIHENDPATRYEELPAFPETAVSPDGGNSEED